ncbi:MAG: efflux RND transporter periplasmic adaptor subunit [Rhodospirillales bacterium]
MKTIRLLALVAALATLTGLGFVTLDSGSATAADDKAAKAPKPAPVVLHDLTFARDREVIKAVGTGRALRSVTVYPSVSGEVTEVAFTAGDAVEAGALLIRLDDKDESLALKAAELEADELRRKVERYRKLVPSGTVSATSLDETRTLLRIAELARDRAEVALEDREVRAAFTGVVGLTDIDPGDRVTPETMITTLDDRSALLVDFRVPERVSARIRVGQPLPVRAWALADKAIEGAIEAIDSRIDPATRMLQVRARIPNADQTLRPGTSFDIELVIEGERFPVLPEVAVLWSRDGAYVWRVVDGKAEKIFVRIVRREKGRALVDGPLAEGDRIVVEGLQAMRPGRAVKPVDGGAPSG